MRFQWAWLCYSSFLIAANDAAASNGSSGAGESPSATSTYVEPNVPTGTPVQGNYTGQYRPQVHFSPPKVRLCVTRKRRLLLTHHRDL